MLDEDVIVGGKYLIGRKIGSGSFGSILLGTDIETAKFVAIKFVTTTFHSDYLIGKAKSLPASSAAL